MSKRHIITVEDFTGGSFPRMIAKSSGENNKELDIYTKIVGDQLISVFRVIHVEYTPPGIDNINHIQTTTSLQQAIDWYNDI